jgi:hypothetical protein
MIHLMLLKQWPAGIISKASAALCALLTQHPKTQP